jgi:hypothetical protein
LNDQSTPLFRGRFVVIDPDRRYAGEAVFPDIASYGLNSLTLFLFTFGKLQGASISKPQFIEFQVSEPRVNEPRVNEPWLP